MFEETTITEEERMGRYYAAPLHVQRLYASPESGKQLRDLFTKNRLDDQLYSVFAITVGDVILDFYKTQDLVNLLTQRLSITQDVATPLARDISAFLNLRDETPTIPTADPTLKERLDLRPSDINTPRTGTAPGNMTGEEMARPLTREELLSALSAKRTMASDIAAVQQQGSAPVQGYEAYQAEKSEGQKE